jgi:dolichyl-phosphate beta-glucosyltransferase
MKIKELSIIFPIYNEEKRLKKNLNKLLNLFKPFNSINFEIILVNDGSTDNSNNIINEFLKLINNKYKKKIFYIYYKINRGKGFALKKGVNIAKKKWILTCDIDFSANPNEMIKWDKLNYIKSDKCCYFGSRKLKNSVIKYKYYRRFVGEIFTLLIYFMFNLNIRDTQCGFKLYNKRYAKNIFNQLVENGYAHDVEIAVLLKKKLIKIIELPIKWTHEEESKVNIFYDGLSMVIKLILIKIRN